MIATRLMIELKHPSSGFVILMVSLLEIYVIDGNVRTIYAVSAVDSDGLELPSASSALETVELAIHSVCELIRSLPDSLVQDASLEELASASDLVERSLSAPYSAERYDFIAVIEEPPDVVGDSGISFAILGAIFDVVRNFENLLHSWSLLIVTIQI